MFVLHNNMQCVLLVSLVLLANAQRSSNNFRDVDIQELARQNKITKQILEAFIQKKLGIRNTYVRPPSIHEILPMKAMKSNKEERPQNLEEEPQEADEPQEGQEYNEDDSLQSVESEQIDSIYDNEGRKKYPTPPFEPELEQNNWNQETSNVGSWELKVIQESRNQANGLERTRSEKVKKDLKGVFIEIASYFEIVYRLTFYNTAADVNLYQL